jgi:hypothetical protein
LRGGIRHELAQIDLAAEGDESPWRSIALQTAGRDQSDQVAEILSKYADFRKFLIDSIAEYKTAIRRLSHASRVLFRVEIAGYSSLDLAVYTAPIQSLAAAFESDFDSFRVFLDIFVPSSFSSIYGSQVADKLEYAIDIPEDFKTAFRARKRIEREPESAATTHASPAPTSPTSSDTARWRAEWLWRLANGSLLVPVILALVVLYFALKDVGGLRELQQEGVESILTHQRKLLEEDRRRLNSLLSTPNSGDGAASKVKTSGNAANNSRQEP